jgi:hypothetical protein
VTKVGRRVLYRRSSLLLWLCRRERHGQDDSSEPAMREMMTDGGGPGALTSARPACRGED